MAKHSNIVPFERPVEAAKAPRALVERDDDDLMLLARGGANAAFDEIVRRYQRRVLRIAAKYVGSASEALDVAQATFLELFRALPGYRARGKLSAYLYRIAINQCRMACRSRARRVEQSLAAASSLPSPEETRPDDEILAREKRREIDSALAELNNKLRDVVALRFAGELSYREIAEVLDIPVGTVKSRLAAALERLAHILEGGRR